MYLFIFFSPPRLKSVLEMCKKTEPLIPRLIYFCPDRSWSAGRVSSTRIVFLGLFGVGKEDHRVRSQGEDKVTDWAEALGQHRAAKSNPSVTLSTT